MRDFENDPWGEERMYVWNLDRREQASRRRKSLAILILAPLPGIALFIYLVSKGLI
jgi:hypothetical protein